MFLAAAEYFLSQTAKSFLAAALPAKSPKYQGLEHVLCCELRSLERIMVSMDLIISRSLPCFIVCNGVVMDKFSLIVLRGTDLE